MYIRILHYSILLMAVLVTFSACMGDRHRPVELEGESSASVSAQESEQSSRFSNAPSPSGQAPQAQSSQQAASSAPSVPLTQTFTVPEGYTLARIGMLLEEREICTVEEWIQAAQNFDLQEFELLAQQPDNPNRCFALEGYLFPDTYEIYTGETPVEILRRMLSHTERKIHADIRRRVQESGFTMDEIITLASIIEKEAFGPQEMANISSVLHNRLNINMQLQCDVTINYVEGAIKPFITGDINRYNEYYNTYKCPALPAGAICNPSLAAIEAALAPAQTDYLYFITDANKKYYYGVTWEDHQQNIAAARLVAQQ